jgi:hypothetical protein
MKAARITGGAGLICVLLAGALLLTGFTPVRLLISVIASALAIVLLAVTFVLIRGERVSPGVPAGPVSVSRQVVTATVVSAAFGLIAAVVAIAVAEGEAQDHALGHLVLGLVCLSLFAALGFLWRPPADSTISAFRGLLLALVWFAAAGAFLESLGGSGMTPRIAETGSASWSHCTGTRPRSGRSSCWPCHSAPSRSPRSARLAWWLSCGGLRRRVNRLVPPLRMRRGRARPPRRARQQPERPSRPLRYGR